MTEPMTVNARLLVEVAARAIDLLEREHAAWVNKGPNELTKSVVDALNCSVDAAHAGNIWEAANQAERAVAAALVLSAGLRVLATRMHPIVPGVH
ncbi:hypothetical protein [Komagataeibacter sp. FNDCF1]|uniref:hypothetical protein n=1 Tax=Komagataeibacter sp. FNDCF1 TaxID=2878681 RepID=UPI001E31E374|nr:hypothetical protein [Komagataeibacter sp. FNDCF1]MCE2566193.1 hypothetical protein [Komagataeibacter sp. FNDCF1]